MNLRSITCEIRCILWMLNPKWGHPYGHIWRPLQCHNPAWRYCAHCHQITFNA